MINPTYGKPIVAPDDIVARLDALIPRSIAGEPLLWVARAVATPVLIDARDEIERLRARVEALEREMRFIGRLDYPPTRMSAQNRARAALEAKP